MVCYMIDLEEDQIGAIPMEIYVDNSVHLF